MYVSVHTAFGNLCHITAYLDKNSVTLLLWYRPVSYWDVVGQVLYLYFFLGCWRFQLSVVPRV